MSEAKTYQKMLTEVDTIVKEISEERIDLDQLVEKIEKGYGLIKKMRGRLDETKQKLEKLRQDFDAPGGTA